MSTVDDLLSQSAWMRGLARRLVRDAAEADDLVQDACLAYLDRDGADPPVSRSWLAGVLRNLARMRARSAARRRKHEARVRERREPPSPAALAGRLELQRRIAAHVAALPEPLRTTVLLRHFEQWDTARIATETGVPASTVRSRLQRARELLRDRLDDDHDGDAAAWCLPLLPWTTETTPPGGAEGATLGAPLAAASGGLLMGTAVKIGIAAAAALLLGWWAVGSAPERVGNSPRAHRAPGHVDDVERPQSARRSRNRVREADDETATTAEADAAAPETEGPPPQIVVRDAAGAPVTGVFLLVDGAGASLGKGTLDDDGRAALPRTESPHTLIVAADGHPPHVEPRGTDAGDVSITLATGAVLEGIVRVDGALPDAPVRVRLDVATSTLESVPADAAALEHLAAAGYGRTHLATWTDARGRFAFAGLDAGAVRSLRPPRGTAIVAGRGDGGGESMRVTAPDRAVVLDVETLPLLTGRVVAADTGLPVPRAIVHLGFLQRIGNTQLYRRSAETADDSGNFAVPVPTREARSVRLTVAHPDDRGHVPVAVPDPLPPGRRDLGDVPLPPLREVALEIRSETGAPVPAAAAVVPSEAFRTSAPSDADGRATLRVAGAVTIHVSAIGFAQVAVPIEATDDVVRVTLPAAASLRVRVLETDGTPAAGGLVLLRTAPRPFATENGHPPSALQEIGGPQLALVQSSDAAQTFVFRTDDEGRVTISGLSTPATVRVTLTDALGTAHGSREIELTGPRARDVDLQFERPATALEGRLLDEAGDPLEGVVVSVEHAPDAVPAALGASRNQPRGLSDADGRFRIEGVRATQAKLVARKPGRATAVRDLPGTRTTPSGGGSLPAGRAAIELGDWTLATGRTVRLHLVDAEGRPLADARIAAFPAGVDIESRGGGLGGVLRQVEPGTYTLAGLPDEACVLRIAKGAVQVTRELAAGVEEARFEIR